MNRRVIIAGALIAALLQSAALARIVWDRHSLLENGQEVVLQSAMVDPRDLFRGHYVTLNLTAGDLSEQTVRVSGDLKQGEPVYVALKPGGEHGFWLADTLFAEMPDEATAPVLRGTLTGLIETATGSMTRYRVTFPFDRFFADKRKAKDLERVRNDRRLGVIIAVGDDGEGAVKGISVDGERIYVETVW